jgi:hypothetical protein
MVTDRSILEQTLKSSGRVRQIPAATITLGTPCESSTDRTSAEADGNVKCPRFLLPQWTSLRGLFGWKETTARPIHVAYRQYGYPLAEIADHMGVHAAMVSRRLKQAEQPNI